MKISIVTISYNQSKYLRDCIDSVLTQGYSDLEYIIVDPGSTDGSREIIDSYGDQVIKIFEKDNGPANGLNKGFALATGDIFGYVNSDDMLLPNALKSVAYEFNRKKCVDILCGHGYSIDASGCLTGKIMATRFFPWLYALGGVNIFQQGTFFKKSCFIDANGFNEVNQTCWDAELLLDMSLNGANFIVRDLNLALFRVHDESITGTGRLNVLYQKDQDRLFEKAFGKTFIKLNFILFILGRLMKVIINPKWFLLKIRL